MARKRASGKNDELLELTPALIEKVVGNEDLLLQILLCVPAKPLIKFKCVSKHWLSLISDPQFCYKHTAQNPNVPSAIYYLADSGRVNLKTLSLNGHKNLPTVPLFKGVEKYPSFGIVHACNGLVLCSRISHTEEYYAVCNLTTNKYTVLIDRKLNVDEDVVLSCLAFDPAKSPHYKVVLGRRCNVIDIYSSEDKSWKHIQLAKTMSRAHRQAFWDGAIYWTNDGVLSKFDVDQEKLSVIPLPSKPIMLTDEMIHYFGECGGSLILVQYRTCFTMGFRILEMKKGETRWTTKHRANLRPIAKLYPENKEFNVLSVLKGPRERDLVLVLAAEYKVFSYNPRSKKVEVICEYTPDEFWNLLFHRNNGWTHAHHFIESLCPV